MASHTVENYIKTIYHLALRSEGAIHTNDISEALGTKAATVTDMLKKLSDQELIFYKKYQGVTLTSKGMRLAIHIIRKHRLWEVFLLDKLEFKWDEVHEIAEELEHINSEELVNRLDAFLDYPKVDPHGDPIPDREGNMDRQKQTPLSDLQEGEIGTVSGVNDSSKEFLQYLDAQGIRLGDSFSVISVFDYDKSRTVRINDRETSLSLTVCKNIYLKKKTP